MRRCFAMLAALVLALGPVGCGRAETGTAEAEAATAFCADGRSAAARGDWSAAVDAFSRAIEADDDRAAAYSGRADCYLALAGSGDTQEAPDLKGLARRDYELALALDPAQGPHIFEVYADLGAEALAAGEADEALCCLAMAQRAAPDEADALLEQVRDLTDGLLTGSVWYMDGPDSRYYVFSAGGTGWMLDAAAMEPAGAFTYENEGFVLSLTVGGETSRWNCDPDREGYYMADEGLSLRLGRTSFCRMYARWQEDILGAEAELRLGGAEEGYGEVYEREYALLEALADSVGTLTEEQTAALSAEQERRALLQEDGSGAREAFEQLRRTVNGFLKRLPDPGGPGGGAALEELFPVGEQTLLDYFRLFTGLVLRERGLDARGGARALTGWESLADVDHYFRDGRLYLRLHGYALLEGKLTPDERGRFAIATPLSLGDDVTAGGETLLSRLQGDDWVSLWEPDYGGETFFLELTLTDDMTCTVRGGGYPAESAGIQSGEYTLEDHVLTLTLAADGYSPGTYQYEVIPMGDSLYMTLLTEGMIYGQTAGSGYVFCGGGYTGDVDSRQGNAGRGER